MQHYITSFDTATGSITGTGVTADGTIPAGAIECTQAQAENPGNYRVVDGAVETLPAPSAIELAAQQAQALQASCTAALATMLDALAKSWGYDSIISAASYVTSGNAQFAAEARTLIDWRDAVWSWGYAQLAAIQAGAKPMPDSVEAMLAEAPAAPDRPAS